MPNKVFISYRREDSRYQARRIYDAFVQALPTDTVFMDVNSLAPGDDFVEILEGWVQQCEVLLALIGPSWIDSIDPRTNHRRLDNPDDFVRIEIRGALERKIPVVPVLLDAAGMPTAAELPDDIKALTRRTAEFVDFRTFDADVQRLIKGLRLGKEVVGQPPQVSQAAHNDSADAGMAKSAPFLGTAKLYGALKSWSRPAILVLLTGGLTLALTAARHNGTQPPDDESITLEMYDALKASMESKRRDAEATIAAANDARIKAEEGTKNAEARAKDALSELEQLRKDTEAKAKAAAAALANAEDDRKNAVDALEKSKKAQLDAETRLKQATDAQAKPQQANDADTVRNQPQSSEKKIELPPEYGVIKPLLLLADIGNNSQWTADGPAGCSNRNESYYSVSIDGNSIKWTNGSGDVDIEAVVSNFGNEMRTATRSSRHVHSEDNNAIGTIWTYSGDRQRLRLRSSLGSDFTLTRCP